jgi:pimeloyl-ACP methyl ester carboxylesterase
MILPSKLIFLPGAGGSPEFWNPVSNILRFEAQRCLMGWPGFGPIPPDETIRGIEDLVKMIISELDQPAALIAQSMGGVVAIKAALQKPWLVTHLILVATSGGMRISDLGAEDWRPSLLKDQPKLPRWFVDYSEDLTEKLRLVTTRTLLIWGDSDPISPIAVGHRLQRHLPKASLRIIEGGEHDLANRLADVVAPIIEKHLRCLD